MTEFHSNEAIMTTGRFLLLSLAMAGCAAAAYAVGRRTRHLESRLSEEGLRTWEDDGGNLSPPKPGQGRLPQRPPELRFKTLTWIFQSAQFQ